MNLKKALLAIAMCFMLLVPAVGAIAYDMYPGSFKEFPATLPPDYQQYFQEDVAINMETSITKIIVLGTAEGLYPDVDENGKTIARRGVGIFGQEGSGFYVGHGYFVTNAHVVIPSAVTVQVNKWVSWTTTPVKIVTLQIMIGQNTGLGSCPGELVWTDYERDLALVKVVGNWPALESLEYELGWTTQGGDQLYPGMAVATIVAIRTDAANGDISKTPFFEVRYGTIVDTHAVIPGPLGTGHSMEENLPWFSINDVTMTTQIYPGDSGSPVFGFENGRPVIIGVARAAVNYYTIDFGPEGYEFNVYYASYFTRIDMVIPFTLEK